MDHSGSPEGCLKANLRALALQSATLCERVCAGVESSHIEIMTSISGGPTACLKHGSRMLLHCSRDPAKEALDAVEALGLQDGQTVLCLGLGLGYYLDALLKRSNPCQPVVAYERDPWLLRLTLSRFDFVRDILSGRVQFLLGTDLARIHSDTGSLFMWPHPVLGTLYEEERSFLGSLPSGQRQRAMVAAGGLFVKDVVDCLTENRIQVLSWDSGIVSREETLHQIKVFDPHFLLSVNYRHDLPEICEALGIPLIIWEIDPTIEKLQPGKYELSRTRIHTYRKSHVARYRKAGFRNVEYLPLASNPNRRHRLDLSDAEREHYGADVSFVGSSMTPQAEDLFHLYQQLSQKGLSRACPSGSPPDFLELWNSALNLQRQSPDRCVIEEHFESALGLHGMERLVTDDEGRLLDLVFCPAEAAAARRRLQVLSMLEPFKVKLWGDDGWVPGIPEHIRYCGPAGHFRELTLIYNASSINLDINRIYQKDIVTMRVFDVLACGAFLLADHSDDLEELFDVETEVVAYHSIEELPKLVEHFLLNHQEREQVATAGCQRVLRDHTMQKRIQQMLQNLP
jgi:spore maturation protein CgeB